MVDRQRLQRFGICRQHGCGGRGPVLLDVLRDDGRPERIAAQRVRSRKVAKVRSQVLLQESPEVDRPCEHLLGGAHRQQAIAVDDFELHVDAPRYCSHHARQEEARELIGDQAAGALCQGLQHAFARPRFRLNVWQVGDAGAPKQFLVVLHALQDKRVQPIARPLVAATQRLEDQQGPPEVAGVLHGPLQAKVGVAPARTGHPIQDVIATLSDGRLIGEAQAILGDWIHGSQGFRRTAAHRCSSVPRSVTCMDP